jgi:hypothetical protein
MLFFLFSEDERHRLSGQLGYEYRPDTARKNIGYHDERTSHGSTPRFIMHTAALAALDPRARRTGSSWRSRGTSVSRPIRVGVGGDVHELCAGAQHTFTLKSN